VSSVRLIWLESFVEVARHGTYNEAGSKLKLDPTVIKRNIVQLEQWLGKSLVYKSTPNPKITTDGEEFLPKATTIIDLLYTSRDFMIDSSNMQEMGQHISSFFAKHMQDQGR
jgi:DNA-binding transcriptional LysR family regulator